MTLTGKLGRVATVEMCEMVRRQHEDRYWLLQLSMSAEESSGVEVMSANLSHFSLFRVVLLFSYHSPQSRQGGDSAQCAQWRAPFDSTALDPPLLITKVEDIFGQPHTTHPLCGHQHRQHHHHHHDLASQNWWCAELHCLVQHSVAALTMFGAIITWRITCSSCTVMMVILQQEH